MTMRRGLLRRVSEFSAFAAPSEFAGCIELAGRLATACIGLSPCNLPSCGLESGLDFSFWPAFSI